MSDNVVSSPRANVSGEEGHFLIVSHYLGSSTLTKAAFAFSILTLLCSHFERTSSHLNPIHQRAKPPHPKTLTPPVFPQLSDVIQTSAGLLKSHFVNAQKVAVSREILPTSTVNLICPCLRGVKPSTVSICAPTNLPLHPSPWAPENICTDLTRWVKMVLLKKKKKKKHSCVYFF